MIAARQLAALDSESGGRLSLRIMAGSYDASGFAETSYGHVGAFRRTDEYLVLLKRLWSNDRPFDHEGAAYSLRNGFVARKGPHAARRCRFASVGFPERPFELLGAMHRFSNCLSRFLTTFAISLTAFAPLHPRPDGRRK